MRLPQAAHTSHRWRIHAIASGFRLEDIWQLPTPGGPDDFPRLVALITSPPARQASGVLRTLFTIRWQVGKVLGWDEQAAGFGSRVSPLRKQLPPDLREAPAGPDSRHFKALYLLEDEYAAEIANQTVHGIMHLGWVEDASGGYRGQMAVYVKPNGLLGRAYMAAITPFRRVLVYPLLLREIGRNWDAATPPSVPHSGNVPSSR